MITGPLPKVPVTLAPGQGEKCLHNVVYDKWHCGSDHKTASWTSIIPVVSTSPHQMGSPWWQPGLLFQWKVTKVRIGTIWPDLGDLTLGSLGTAFHLSVDDWDDWGFSKCSSASLHFNNSWFNHESAICCAGTTASLLDVRCPTQSQPSRLGPKASIRRLFGSSMVIWNLTCWHITSKDTEEFYLYRFLGVQRDGGIASN